MSDEQQLSTNTNTAANEDNIEIVLANKDTQQENENGYESECSSSSRSEEEIAYSALETEADAFTRFIERQHMETMYELRRLRLGERPVTGQSNRQRIATFFDRTETSTVRPAPARSAHMDDINALENRRCVSTVLSSASFRSDLENSIRRTIGTRTIQPAVPPQPQPLQPPPPPPPLQPFQPLNLERQEQRLNAWQTITDLQRERIVVEISDLVHRQLVTSALESDFRRHLEHNVLHRLERGAPVEFQQQQQPVTITVQPNPLQAARINNSDIDALTTRLDSMQQMLQMMFTMQMDMQRSLRQEIAGSLANQTPHIIQQAPMQAGHCTVCLTALADTVLYRCGHLCICYTCGLQLQQTRTVYGIKCPICRAPVDDILRVYRSSRDGE